MSKPKSKAEGSWHIWRPDNAPDKFSRGDKVYMRRARRRAALKDAADAVIETQGDDPSVR